VQKAAARLRQFGLGYR